MIFKTLAFQPDVIIFMCTVCVTDNNGGKIALSIIISALINGLLANSIITVINPNVTIEVITVLRFFIGDILGALSVMLAIWVIFTTLVDTRLIISPDNK